jgi:hypothetical protein
MHVIKSIGWVVGISLVAGVMSAAPASADSYSDITGTNIWNNTAPIFETDTELPDGLIANITRVNRESEQAFDTCNNAIAQAEQNTPTIRRYARQPATETAALPAACRQLEALRAEADNLRRTVEDVERSRSNPALLTW